MYPTTLLDVLAFHVNETLCCGADVPEPVTDSTVGVLKALLRKLKVPDAVPLACGEKITEKERLLPAGIVAGNVRPLRENSDWVTVADESVTGPLLAVRLAT